MTRSSVENRPQKHLLAGLEPSDPIYIYVQVGLIAFQALRLNHLWYYYEMTEFERSTKLKSELPSGKSFCFLNCTLKVL